MRAEKYSQRILASALDGAVVRPARPDEGVDLLVHMRDGSTVPIEVKWAGEGWPDDVRRVAARVPRPWPSNLVVVARHLSPGAIEWLRERDANWADESGQVRIVGPDGLLVIREPSLRAISQARPTDLRWSPSAGSIAETILARPDEPLRVEPLADMTQWSVPQVANVLQSFDAQGWTEKRGPARGRGAHRELVDPDAMLAAWSAALAGEDREMRVAHRATRNVMSLLRGELRQALDGQVGWAVSGWAGLELAAPFTTTIPSLHIYVTAGDFAGPLSTAIRDADLREVPEGGRVTFWRADERIIGLASRRDDLPVASVPRLYADLSSFGARGQDAADHVKRELIDPLHPARDVAEATATPKDQA